jgi:hypothetical protein
MTLKVVDIIGDFTNIEVEGVGWSSDGNETGVFLVKCVVGHVDERRLLECLGIQEHCGGWNVLINICRGSLTQGNISGQVEKRE